jgi:hypothetical protein
VKLVSFELVLPTQTTPETQRRLGLTSWPGKESKAKVILVGNMVDPN